MSNGNDWGSGGHHVRHGSYDEIDHSDQEIYVYDQCCRNCRYFYGCEYGSQCMRPGADEFDTPADDGSDWCEYWKGKGGRD